MNILKHGSVSQASSALIALIFSSVFVGFSLAQDFSAEAPSIAEVPSARLIEICNEARDAQSKASVELQTASQKIQFDRFENIFAEQIRQLEDFEIQNRASDAGILAIRQIFQIAARGGPPTSAAYVSRQKYFGLLDNYLESELLPSVLTSLAYGAFDRQGVEALATLQSHPNATPAIKQQLALTHAKMLMQGRGAIVALPTMIVGVESTPLGQEDKAFIRSTLELSAKELPSKEWIDQRLEVTVRELEKMLSDTPGQTIPQYEGLDEYKVILQPTAKKPRLSLSDMINAFLIREYRMAPGSPAQELELDLLNGEKWKLSDQKGKLVIIQFSFLGCGPCERMYKELSKLKEVNAESVSLLTILVDEDKEDAIATAASGKISWAIAWDAPEVGLKQRWVVEGFPQLFFVDATGNWADLNQIPEELGEAISKLQ
jgi:thioredoxin-related protein